MTKTSQYLRPRPRHAPRNKHQQIRLNLHVESRKQVLFLSFLLKFFKFFTNYAKARKLLSGPMHEREKETHEVKKPEEEVPLRKSGRKSTRKRGADPKTPVTPKKQKVTNTPLKTPKTPAKTLFLDEKSDYSIAYRQSPSKKSYLAALAEDLEVKKARIVELESQVKNF